MSLRTRTLTLIALAFFAMLVALFFFSGQLILDSYVRLEENQVAQRLQQVQNALDSSLQSLMLRAADWSHWNEVHAFVRGENPSFPADELPSPDIVTNMGLQMMLFVDANGELVLAKVVDAATGEEIPLPEDAAVLVENPLAKRPPEETDIRGGLTVVNQTPTLVTFAPILRTDGEPPAAGTLIFVQYLDAAQIAGIGAMLQLPLTLYPLEGADLPEDVARAAGKISDAQPVVIHGIDNHTIAGYLRLVDVNHAPLLIARIEMPREIFAQGQSTASIFIVALIITGFVIMGLIAVVLERTVLSRLDYLSKSIDKIQAGSASSVRVFVSGRDELARLGDGLNQMLSRIEAFQRSIQTSEARMRAIVETAPLLIWVVNQNEHLTFLEGRAIEKLKLQPAKMLGQPVAAWSEQIGIEASLLRQAFGGMEATSQVDIGEMVFNTAYRPLRAEHGAVIGVVGVAIDVTGAVRAEKALKEKTNEAKRVQDLLQNVDNALQRSASPEEIQSYVNEARKELDD